MITTRERTEIDAYLDAVRTELADLPDDDRVEMLEDIEQHLLEVAAEGSEPLESRLGAPAEYAAELRAAAGLSPRSTADDPFAQRVASRISGSRLLQAVRRDRERLEQSRTFRDLRTFLRPLRPAWWMLRGYLAAAVIGAATADYPHALRLFPRFAGDRLTGALMTIALIFASVKWSAGRHAASSRWRFLTIAGNVALALALLNFADNAPGQRIEYVRDSQNDGIVRGPYGNILNIYPYAADGTPLKDVLLLDQDGNPIPGVLMGQFARDRGVRDRNGNFIAHLFPYAEPMIDERTGEIVGTRSHPPLAVNVPPAVPAASFSAQPSMQASPASLSPAPESSASSPSSAAQSSSASSVSPSRVPSASPTVQGSLTTTPPPSAASSSAMSPSPSPAAE